MDDMEKIMEGLEAVTDDPEETFEYIVENVLSESQRAQIEIHTQNIRNQLGKNCERSTQYGTVKAYIADLLRIEFRDPAPNKDLLAAVGKKVDAQYRSEE